MLNQAETLNGYTLESLDGEIGHVEDFNLDDDTWAIRYLLVGPRVW